MGREGITLLIAAFLLVGSTVSARCDSMEGEYRDGELVVKLRVSHLGIRTSDRLALTLEAVAPAGELIVLPSYHERLGDFRIREARLGQLRLSDDRETVEISSSWVLEPYLPGSYGIPALIVTSRQRGDEDGVTRRVETPLVSIEVASVISATEEKPVLREASGPMRDQTPWLPVILFLVLAPPGVAMILRIFRRGEHERRRLEAEKEEAADLVALAALDAIGGQEADAEGIGVRVQEVMGRYLQGRFHQRTMGRSLDEVSKRLDLEASARGIFERLVEQLQLARYGKREGAANAATQACRLLGEFVRETTSEAEKGEAL